ncbi:MAG: hypothetical protein FGM33_05380 [Candidatus Kapabacteria bacterium]|nr:hypothetical protein [Candidatus Kapabacteria bacterium]
MILRWPLLIAACFVLLTAGLAAQSAPVLSTDSIVAEFIGSNTRPKCVIRGVFIDGHVDTVRAALKTSTIRTTVGGYARYKPVIDSVWLVPISEQRHEMFIRLRLSGQRLPLPSRGVRGVVRLTVAAAAWTGTDWASTSSEELEVPIANLEIPRPIIGIGQMSAKRVRSTPRALEFEISGIGLNMPKPDSVGGQVDVRSYEVDNVTAQFDDGSLLTSDPEHDSLRSVRLTTSYDASTGITIRGVVTSPGARPGAKVIELTSVKLSLQVRARLRCRTDVGPFRMRIVEIEL